MTDPATHVQIISGTDIRVMFDRPEFWSRVGYRVNVSYSFNLLSGYAYAGKDLSIVAKDTEAETLAEAFRSLMGFLSAAVDSYDYAVREMTPLENTEHGELFPKEILEWGSENADEITMWGLDEDYNDANVML